MVLDVHSNCTGVAQMQKHCARTANVRSSNGFEPRRKQAVACGGRRSPAELITRDSARNSSRALADRTEEDGFHGSHPFQTKNANFRNAESRQDRPAANRFGKLGEKEGFP